MKAHFDCSVATWSDWRILRNEHERPKPPVCNFRTQAHHSLLLPIPPPSARTTHPNYLNRLHQRVGDQQDRLYPPHPSTQNTMTRTALPSECTMVTERSTPIQIIETMYPRAETHSRIDRVYRQWELPVRSRRTSSPYNTSRHHGQRTACPTPQRHWMRLGRIY